MASNERDQKPKQVGTFRCQHWQVGNVVGATCAVCGPMERAPLTPWWS